MFLLEIRQLFCKCFELFGLVIILLDTYAKLPEVTLVLTSAYFEIGDFC